MIRRKYTLLLACDDYIYFTDGKYYAANKERWEFYNRYLRVFDRMKLACRCIVAERIREEFVELLSHIIEVVHIDEFHGPSQYAKVYFRIGRQIRRITDNVDAAVIRLPSTVAERVGFIVKKHKIPYAVEVVYNVHESFMTDTDLFSRTFDYIIDQRVKNLCYKADGVSCVTEFELQKHYFSKKSDSFKSHYSSLSINESFFTGKKVFPDKKILTIAHVANEVNLNSRKGHRMIVDMLAKLKEEGIIVNVGFVGKDYNGGIKSIKDYAYNKGVFGQVSFPGYLSRQALRSFLEESDLFVFPTRAEGLPRVLIEAMALGLPCLATNISGNRELLEESFLFDLSNLDELSDKVKCLIKDKTLYEKASQDNYIRSLKYESTLLEKRRDEFYTELKHRCE